MRQNVFKLARQAVSGPLIERMFSCEGSRWEGDEFRTLSPLRADARTGSFAIRKDGCWYDFATGEGGDFIELVGRARNCPPLEAAKHIVRQAGSSQALEATETDQGRSKSRAILPIPAAASDSFKAACDNDLTRGRYGILAGVWPYRQADGQTLFYVCRYEAANAKEESYPVVLR